MWQLLELGQHRSRVVVVVVVFVFVFVFVFVSVAVFVVVVVLLQWEWFHHRVIIIVVDIIAADGETTPGQQTMAQPCQLLSLRELVLVVLVGSE